MSSSIQFVLHRHLNANHRLHWRTRNDIAQEVKGIAFWNARAARMKASGRVRVVIWVSYPDRRRRDVGNLFPTAKAVVDGLVKAGVFPDDSDQYVEGPDLRPSDVLSSKDTIRLRVSLEPATRT